MPEIEVEFEITLIGSAFKIQLKLTSNNQDLNIR